MVLRRRLEEPEAEGCWVSLCGCQSSGRGLGVAQG
jgi:hypothetical protein